MPVDSAATSNTSCLLNDQTINARQGKKFIYVTSQLDGSDVITRRYPARQHNVGVVSLHTHRRYKRVTGTPTSCQLFKRHGSKLIPALYH